MASEFLIPHPNIPTADIGLPKLKEVTVKNNENFLALDRLLQEFNAGMSSLDRKIEAQKHDHPYAPLVHEHQLTDVEGLIPALEQKAPLVHTHPEYLTSVPEHNHTIYNVNGLVEALADKANAQHSHNIDEVNGLLNALAAKASTADVNWLFANMTKLTQSETPLVDGNPQSGAGVIGTSDKAARADHRHPVNKTSDVSNVKRDGNGTGGTPQIGTLYSYALTDHSHPLNEPDATERTQESVLAALLPDGSNSGQPYLGGGNWYAPLQHSHKTNFRTSGTPTDISTTAGTEGTAKEYAHADHTHKLPKIEQSHVNGLEDDLDFLDGRVTTLEGKFPATGFVKSVANVNPTNGDVAKASLVDALKGTTAGTLAEGNHTHTHDDITDWGTATDDFLTDADIEDCIKEEDFVLQEDGTLDPSGRVAHSHLASDVIVVGGTTERRLGSYFEQTGNDLDGSQVRLATAGKWVKTNALTGRLETTEDQPVTTDGTEVESFIPAFDADGNLTNSAIPDASLASQGQVLTADGDGAASWSDPQFDLSQVDNNKVAIAETYTDDGVQKKRLTSKSTFATKLNDVFKEQNNSVEVKATKVSFNSSSQVFSSGDFVVVDQNGNLTTEDIDTQLSDYAKASDLSSVRTLAQSASSAAASAATAASQAKTAANEAKTDAQTAQSTAEAAQSAADASQSAVDELSGTVGGIQDSLVETNAKLDNQITTFSNFQDNTFAPLRNLVDTINGDYVTGTEYDVKMALVDDDITQLKTDVESALTEEDVGDTVAPLDGNGVVPKENLPDIELDDLPEEVAYLGSALDANKLLTADSDGAIIPSGITIPTTAPTSDKVLTEKTDGSFAWEDRLDNSEGTPVAISHGHSETDEDPPAELAPQGQDYLWECGGGDGYSEYALVYSRDSGDYKSVWWVKKDYAADGRLLRVHKAARNVGYLFVG